MSICLNHDAKVLQIDRIISHFAYVLFVKNIISYHFVKQISIYRFYLLSICS